MKKERSHTVLMRVTFDKPTTRAWAVRNIRDCIHGEFFTAQFEDEEPASFKVSSIVSASPVGPKTE